MVTKTGPEKINLRQLNTKGLAIAIIMPVILVGALVATLLGAGAFSRDMDEDDGMMWLWTTPSGEMARINGLTASADTRHAMPDAQGNMVQIEQTDSHLMMRDIATGKVSAIDLKTLATTATAETAPGEGVRLAMHRDGAFIVDRLQGIVRQVDPTTLAEVGAPLQFPPGITGGTFDEDGTLWLGVPREGTLVEVAPRQSGAVAGESYTVAAPAQDLSLTVLKDGVAVLNSTLKTMTTLRDGDLTSTPLELVGPEKMAESSPGTIAALTVTNPPGVITVDGQGDSQTFNISANDTPLLGAAVEFNQRIYVPDGTAGLLWVYNLDGQEIDRIEVPSNNGPLELYSAGGMLFVNAPYSNTAVVIDDNGNARRADKARDDILGGDMPPIDEPEDEDNSGDEGEEGDEGADGEPEIGPPGEVGSLVANGGNGEVTLSWEAAPNNGSALTKYEIEGNGETREVAPGQRVVDISDLTNGETYEFTVTAFNGEGSGPPVSTGPVMPSDEVPGAVSSVDATVTPGGGVDLSWPEADDQGNPISHYTIEEVNTDGDRRSVGQANGTSTSIAPEDLSVGEPVAFQVTTVANSGSASEPSPLSDTVTPFDVPDAPGNMYAETDQTSSGSINVSWDQARANGSVVTEYRVSAGGQTTSTDGTTATLDGFADGEQVEVQVVAVNEAGESEPATATANTLTPPSVVIDGVSATATTMTASFSIDDGGAGGEASCTMTVNNRNANGNCSQLTVDGLNSSTNYDVQVRVATPAGEDTATGSGSTSNVGGTVVFVCSDPADDTYCDGTDSDRISIRAQNNHSSAQRGSTGPGQTFNTICYWGGGELIHPNNEDHRGIYREYNPGKNSTDIWIRIDYGNNESYIPFAYFDINGEGKNSTGPLPAC
ncbi:fibronectin type III domain-containing protein [Natronoglycomyces albus]|uniref:Fibronectin type III domain-containing protein n=1 Tax=Natronoglycomyces albus TaxID=2811108 RepID=A0A895XPN9_9ACTN|nr:fibronectin type III domain-containing protein [Natronoglycomyces albus]QSB04496.1 fibronectin type III domain-containing protein [Natronoglycomyces albus]